MSFKKNLSEALQILQEWLGHPSQVETLPDLDRNCFQASCDLVDNILPDLSYDSSWTKTVDGIFYRTCPTRFSALSQAGALADGGRANIGGSQSGPTMIKRFGSMVQKRGALYVSDNAATALMEAYGSVSSLYVKIEEMVKNNPSVEVFRLTHQDSQISVVDYDLATRDLCRKLTVLSAHLELTRSMNGLWPDLKRPAPCQILAHWLVDESPGVSGLLFQSSADPSGNNLALYFNDDNDAANYLRAEVLSF